MKGEAEQTQRERSGQKWTLWLYTRYEKKPKKTDWLTAEPPRLSFTTISCCIFQTAILYVSSWLGWCCVCRQKEKIGLRSSYFWAKWKQANKKPLSHPLRVDIAPEADGILIFICIWAYTKQICANIKYSTALLYLSLFCLFLIINVFWMYLPVPAPPPQKMAFLRGCFHWTFFTSWKHLGLTPKIPKVQQKAALC